MTRAELEQVEAALTRLVENRRQLGNFDVNAPDMLTMGEALLLFNQHLLEKKPRPKTHPLRKAKSR